MNGSVSRVAEVIGRLSEQAILDPWIATLLGSASLRQDIISERDLRKEAVEFIGLFRSAIARGGDALAHDAWTPVLEFLEDLSRSRARLGATPSETAEFVLSLKQPLFTALRAVQDDTAGEADGDMWTLNMLLDRLGLHTVETFVRGREEVINRQQQEMLELSTPVVELWDGVLALPLIGTLDSSRTQVVMEELLQAIVDRRAGIAIIDITGVPMVDTLVAQHLLKTIAAARLMGAECIISGIRPQIAQTIVHLGVDLGEVVTKSNLADAFALALRKVGRRVVSIEGGRVA